MEAKKEIRTFELNVQVKEVEGDEEARRESTGTASVVKGES